MDGRTELVIGGLSTVAASVAVVCAVALTNSVALADAPGTTVASPRVLVPAAPSPTPPPAASSAADTPAFAVIDQAEVVAVPAPVVVERRLAPGNSAAQTESAAAAAPVFPANAHHAPIARASSAADRLREWTGTRAGSSDRIDSSTSRLQDSDDASEDAGRYSGEKSRSGADETVTDAEQSVAQRSSGSFEVISLPTPAQAGTSRPAQAGSPADQPIERSGVGAKKDRSRDSPDSRDR